MTADTKSLEQSGLNAFLFAEVGTEPNGMVLSVLSVLARLDLDPWQEAGRLAGLPRTKSVDALARMIKATPANERSPSEVVSIATRLVDLLPAHAGLRKAGRTVSAAAVNWTPTAPRGGQGGRLAKGVALTERQWFGLVILLSVALAAIIVFSTLRGTDSSTTPVAAARSPLKVAQDAAVPRDTELRRKDMP